MRPLISRVEKGSFADGPGIRSVVFFKGCPLGCLWCHNPENRSYEEEVLRSPEKCLGCGNCSTECLSGALERVGHYRPPEELAEELLRDRSFYEASGGGVTFSGGEPLSHPGYVAAVARILKREGISLAVETAGAFDYPSFREEVLPLIDHVLFDLKAVDPVLHRRLTGRSNRRILENLERLARSSVDLAVSVIFVPGLNTAEEELRAAAGLIRRLGVPKVYKRFYHSAGREKAERLGLPWPEILPPRSMTPAECREEAERFDRFLAEEGAAAPGRKGPL